MLWSAALLICTGALVLSRTRASWLALMAWGAAAFVLLIRGPSIFDVPGAEPRPRAGLTAVIPVVVGAARFPTGPARA